MLKGDQAGIYTGRVRYTPLSYPLLLQGRDPRDPGRAWIVDDRLPNANNMLM